MFELKLNDKTIQLKWGTWAMYKYCEKYNIQLDQFFEILSNTKYNLSIVVDFFYIGYTSACMLNKSEIKFDETDACEWIDEVGGLFATDGQIVDYFNYILKNTQVLISGVKKDEKKKPNKAKLG